MLTFIQLGHSSVHQRPHSGPHLLPLAPASTDEIDVDQFPFAGWLLPARRRRLLHHQPGIRCACVNSQRCRDSTDEKFFL